MMHTHVVVWCGDSITAGNHLPAGQDYPTLVAGALSLSALHNLGGPSSEVNETQGSAADLLYDASKDINICSAFWGPNDIADVGVTAFVSNLKTFCANRKATGFYTVAMTVLPFNTYPNANSLRDSANATLRADTSFCDLLIDLGATSTTMGADAACANTSLYLDGIHPTFFGNQLLTKTIAAALLTPLAVVLGVGRRGF